MRIEHLACLIEIKRRKSLSTAAGHLGLTQQALSACIKSMENELGVPLLIRTRQGSSLTPEGEEVLEAAENIVSCYRRLRSSLSRQNEPELPSRLAGELRLYTNSPFYLPFNPEIIKKFCEQHPQLRLSITELPQDTIYEKLMSPLAEGTDQIGIINIPFGPGGELLREFLPPFPHLPAGAEQASFPPDVAQIPRCHGRIGRNAHNTFALPAQAIRLPTLRSLRRYP